MDWDGEPLPERESASAPRRRRYPSWGLFDLNRLVLILIEGAALTGIILGDIWLWARV